MARGITVDKRALRRKALDIRAGIIRARREAEARAIARHGLDFLSCDDPCELAGYYPVKGEIDVLPLMADAAERGWRTSLPVIESWGKPLIFRRWEPGDPVKEGLFGIPVPAQTTETVTPRRILVPLLAFDARGVRLGFGGGFYDRTLARLRAQGEVEAVGVAYDEQEMSNLPIEPHDQRLDWVLTPTGPRRFPLTPQRE